MKTNKPTAANRKALETIIGKLETLTVRIKCQESKSRLIESKSALIRILNNWR